MARKKQEIALQVEIESQEEWEEMLAKEGLTVVDTYMEWAGPCKAMVANFRRLKNELGDDLLHFSAAKTDSVDALERYRSKCEPCFLFFAGGVLVAQVRGANSPLLLRTITEQLAYEHKVLEGNAERKEIKDPMLADLETERDEEEEDEEEGGLRHKGEHIIFESLPEFADDDVEMEERKKTVTVAIIKPNVVEEGKVEEVIQQMKEAGIDILESEERQLSDDDARKFYSHKQDEEYFEDLIKYMTSGPCHVLVISKGDTGDGIIEEWRDLLGPASMDEAKEQAPESLRAKYGRTESYVNALHGSDSEETAMRELAFFFPDYSVPTVQTSKKKPKIQRTLALIRPDALKEHKDAILSKIEEAGFKVAMQKEMQLTKEQAEEFYREHQEQTYFDALTTSMASGPLLALGLAREEAVTGWRDLLGPKEVDKAKEEAPESLRAQFSVDEAAFNQLHGSDTPETAKAELDFFFPMQQTIAVIKPDGYQTKDEIMEKIREAGFHIAARKETELTKDIAEQFYKDLKDKKYFEDLTQHMTSGPTLFMVLSRENAVEGWRSLIGPTDPQVAKEQAEDSLRARFGTDIKCNAIHGSSSVDHARESMNLVFGDLQFTADGAVAATAEDGDQAEDDTEQQGEAQQETEQQGEDQEEMEQQGEEQQETEQQEQAEEGEQMADDGQQLAEDGRKSAEDGAKSPTESAKAPEDGRASAEGSQKSAQGSRTSLQREKTEDEDQKEAAEGQDADKTSQAGAAQDEKKDESPEQSGETKDEPTEQKKKEKVEDEKAEDDAQKVDEQRSESPQDKPEAETKAEGETQAEQTTSPEPETTPPADEQTTTEAKEDESAQAPDQSPEEQQDDTQTAVTGGEETEVAAESEEPEVSPEDNKDGASEAKQDEPEETKDEEQVAATESGKASPAQKDG